MNIEEYKRHERIYSPEDITEVLMNLTGLTGSDDHQKAEEITNALYNIAAISENPYNFDYWRELAAALYDIVEAYNNGEISRSEYHRY